MVPALGPWSAEWPEEVRPTTAPHGDSGKGHLHTSRTYINTRDVAWLVKNQSAMWETWVLSLSGKIPWRKIPWRRDGYPLQNSGLENSMDSPWCCEESDTTERLSFHFKDSLDLEENIAKISTLKSGTNLQEVCTHVGFPPQGELSLGSEFI